MTNVELDALGACMLSPKAYFAVADIMRPEDLEAEAGREVLERMADLARKGRDWDAVALAHDLPHLADWIIDTSAATAGIANARGYAERVVENATARRVKAAGERIARLGRVESPLVEAQRILAAAAPRMVDAIRPLRDFLRESQRGLVARHEAGGEITGVASGIPELDAMTAGWQPGDLIVLAARPSVGKTAFSLQCAYKAARMKHPVLFVSLEMGGAQLADRLIAHVAKVDGQSIRVPSKIAEDEWGRITGAYAETMDVPLHVDEQAGQAVESIIARIQQFDAQHRAALVVIDYLTQITPPRGSDTMADKLQHITRAIKACAKSVKAPVILLSQLNRDGESKRPTMASLRSSGAIEQDADTVLFLHKGSDDGQLVELILEKQRNGPTGSVWLHFDKPRQRFYPTDERPAKDDAKSSAPGFDGVPRKGRAVPVRTHASETAQ